MDMVIERFGVYVVALDPTIGAEIQKSRPCVVVSPDEMNRAIRTVIIAPMTSHGRAYPTRIACVFDETAGQIVLDQLRTVDKSRLLKRIGTITDDEQDAVLAVLAEMFAR
jgi:mRNA interferase MazF